ncbi:MAG: hypothetical protein ACM3IH_13840 [Sphingobacteriales bacterium]
MSIAAIGPAHTAPVSPERAEGPGPDHDGDADDVGLQPSIQAAPAPGTGVVVDKKA